MLTIIASPGSYIQGPGEITRLYGCCKKLGCKRAYIIIDKFIYDNYKDSVSSGFEAAGAGFEMSVFGGECSEREIEKHSGAIGECDVVIGIGGGKTLDCAKAVAYHMQRQTIIVPTAASSDAPCSRLSVIYNDDGSFDKYLPLPKNPDIVAVDTRIIANAPARFLASGMGDALATYYEARACLLSQSQTMAGGKCSQAAITLARLCRDTLLSDGKKALLSVKDKCCTPALEKIVEANTYLSGIGFESGGLAAAHAVHNGLTSLSECHHMLHGEKVTFGVLTQLALENAPDEELKKIVMFCRDIGLPTTLSELGLSNVDDERLMSAAKLACSQEDTMSNMPFEVTADDVLSAMRLADAFSRSV